MAPPNGVGGTPPKDVAVSLRPFTVTQAPRHSHLSTATFSRRTLAMPRRFISSAMYCAAALSALVPPMRMPSAEVP